jgi:hypothetical protein
MADELKGRCWGIGDGVSVGGFCELSRAVRVSFRVGAAS